MITFPFSFTFISDEVSQDPVEVAEFARKHGLGGIELRSMFGRQFRDLTDADVRKIRNTMSAYGLKIHGCSTPVFKCRLADASQRREHLEVFCRAIDMATALDCDLLRVFTFLRDDQPPSDDDIRRAAGHVHELDSIAPEGMKIGVENEASCLVGTGQEVVTFLREIHSARVGIIWDPCNVLYVPGYRGTATEGFEEILPRIIHIHAKDAVRTADGTAAARMGEGEVGWPAHFRQIQASPYDGLVSLETHWRMEALGAEELHLPGGYAFSHGGKPASEACFKAIARMC